jgi:hypothetical protein
MDILILLSSITMAGIGVFGMLLCIRHLVIGFQRRDFPRTFLALCFGTICVLISIGSIDALFTTDLSGDNRESTAPAKP